MISEEKLAIFSDTIRDWISQLRSLAPPPSDSICGFLTEISTVIESIAIMLLGPSNPRTSSTRNISANCG